MIIFEIERGIVMSLSIDNLGNLINGYVLKLFHVE